MVKTNAERQAEFRARRAAEMEQLRNAAKADKEALIEALKPHLFGLYDEGQKNMATISPFSVAIEMTKLCQVLDNYLAGRPLDHKQTVIPPADGERPKRHVPEVLKGYSAWKRELTRKNNASAAEARARREAEK